MKKILIAALLIIPLATASCTRTERAATLGATSGAIIGGVITNNVRGAALGAVIGAGAAVLISKSERRGYCVYQDRRGRQYERRCR